MGVLIGIDFGKKRTGLAHTDSEKIIASGLTTLMTKNVLSFLSDYQKETIVEKFVVGRPYQRDGNQSEVEEDIKLFIRELKKSFPKVMVVRHEERFTSKMALKSLIQIGAKKRIRKDKKVIDEISATIILQSFLTLNSKSVL